MSCVGWKLIIWTVRCWISRYANLGTSCKKYTVHYTMGTYVMLSWRLKTYSFLQTIDCRDIVSGSLCTFPEYKNLVAIFHLPTMRNEFPCQRITLIHNYKYWNKWTSHCNVVYKYNIFIYICFPVRQLVVIYTINYKINYHNLPFLNYRM